MILFTQQLGSLVVALAGREDERSRPVRRVLIRSASIITPTFMSATQGHLRVTNLGVNVCFVL